MSTVMNHRITVYSPMLKILRFSEESVKFKFEISSLIVGKATVHLAL